jgi:hypothetical protein
MSTRTALLGLTAALATLGLTAPATACPYPGHHSRPVVTPTPDPTTPVTPTPDPTGLPDGVQITVVTVNGTGCPVGTADVSVAPDGQTVTATYSQFVAEVAPGQPAAASRKNCQLNLAVTTPDGITVGVNQVSVGGDASIAAGATAIVRNSVYFQGSTATGAITNTIAGPYEDVWQFTEHVAAADMVWRPCGGDQRNLNINTSITVNKGSSGTASSYLTVDSPAPLFRLGWDRC